MTRDNIIHPAIWSHDPRPVEVVSTDAEAAEALGWSMLFAGMCAGIVIGVLAVCIPATVIAVVAFGWPW